MEMSEKKRLAWLDSIKGFAIIMVVLGHIASGYIQAGLYPENSGVMVLMYNFTYAFHMPLFFVLSGFSFGFAYVYESYVLKKDRIKAQLINIIMLYFLWSIIQWATKMLMSDYVNNEYTLTDLLWMPLKAMAPYWYLYVLAFCYLLTYFFIRKKIKIKYLLAFSFVLCLLHTWIEKMCGLTIMMTSSYYFFFILGLFVSKSKTLTDFLKKYINIIPLLIIGVAIGLIFSFTKDYRIGWSDIPLIGSIMALALSLAFIGAAQRFAVPLLETVGRYSLEIFLLNSFITAANRKILPALGINNFALNIIVNLLMATALPVLFGLVLKKIRLHSLFFKPYALLSKKSSN